MNWGTGCNVFDLTNLELVWTGNPRIIRKIVTSLVFIIQIKLFPVLICPNKLMLPPHKIFCTISLHKNVTKTPQSMTKTHPLIIKRNGNVQILCKTSNIVIVDDGINIIRKGWKDHNVCILVYIMSNQLVKTLQVTWFWTIVNWNNSNILFHLEK